MAVHNEIGALGEDFAASMLEAEGYTILHRNWRPEKGRQEVDIIAKIYRCLSISELYIIKICKSPKCNQNRKCSFQSMYFIN
ncbi:MAG: YraN family protein [Paludibacteraceae bacterium]|nr:YraN family protein [Paludibacteraceae bacterium]